MNYKSDLDECLTYFELFFFNLPRFRILFYELPSLLLHFD